MVSSASSPWFPALSKFLKHFSSYSSSSALYSNLLDSSTHQRHLTQIHAQLVVVGGLQNYDLATKLVRASANLGEIHHARKVFEEISEPNVILWNAIIRGYSRHKLFNDALEMYSRMQMEGVSPDGFTLPYVLTACSSLSDLKMGQLVHSLIFKHGFQSDVFVQNGLVALYAKFGEIEHARVVFDGLLDRTIVSWTSIVSGYAQNGQPLEALRIFCQMRRLNVMPDWIALVSVLRAYTDVEDLKQGKSVHSCVIKMDLELEPDLLIELTTMYAKCGEVQIARQLFNQIELPDVILWNVMISGYAKNRYADEAVEVFRMMISKKVRPDSISVISAIIAFAQVGSLELARWMDDFIYRSEFKNDVFVNTALIDMYAKCGSIGNARRVFDRISNKDVAVWSAMVVSYGLQGRGREAIDLFDEMELSGVKPNDVTFDGLLLACKNSGRIQEAWDYFHCMRDYDIVPRHQHYACVVDLLGRGGYCNEAYEFITNMPIDPGVTVWGALLNACRIYRHVDLGVCAAEKVFSLDPFNAEHYVHLSNLYASVRMWKEVAKVKETMQEKGLSMDLGYGLIEIHGRLQAFRMGDKSHPKSKEIYEELDRLERKLKESGFHDLKNYDNRMTDCNHSQRLAIAYGLISTPTGTTLRIIKNLQPCPICHSTIKVISKLVGRKIVVRDADRFHYFKD